MGLNSRCCPLEPGHGLVEHEQRDFQLACRSSFVTKGKNPSDRKLEEITNLLFVPYILRSLFWLKKSKT